MASLEQVNEALRKVVAFLAPLVPLIGCHMVDFLTLGHWDTLLTPQLQQDLLNLPSDALHLLPSAAMPHTPDNTTQGNDKPWSLSSSDLSSFLSQVRRHCPAALGVTTPIEQILGEYGSAEISVLAMKGIMSHKKTHEVDTMAQVIARLAKGLGVRWLVDLGSGRGYLSTSLVLQYSQSVVAIDSSSTNTTSALVRNTKLKRWWDNLKKAWLDKAEGRPIKKGKKTRRKKTPTSPQQQQEQVWKREDTEEEDRKQKDRKQGNINLDYIKQENISQEDRIQENIAQEDRKHENICQDRKQENTISHNDRKKEEKRQEDKRKEDFTPQNRVSSESHATHHIGCYIGVTKFITEDTDLLEVVRSAIRIEKVAEDSRNRDENGIVKNDGGLSLEDKLDHYTSSHTTSVNTTCNNTTSKNTHTGKQAPDIKNTTDFCSPSYITSLTHTNTTTKNTNTREQPPDIENSTDHYTPSPTTSIDTTHMNTTTKNTNTRTPPPDRANTTDHCAPSHTSSIGTTHTNIAAKNTNTKTPPPSPPDSHQEPTTTCMVGETSALGLVGLHTCGNLASSSLRLFIANPRVAFLCNVGCCYHLLEEEYSQNTYNQQKTRLDEGKPPRLSQKEECVSRCKEEKGVLATVKQENYALKSSTGHTEQVGTPIRLTHEEESVQRCEEEKEILVAIIGENESLKSSTGHTEEAGQPTRLTHREESVQRCEEEKEPLVAVEKESESLKSSTGHKEHIEKPARLTHSEEEGVPSEEEKEVLAAIRQEGGALKSSTGYTEQEQCRKDSLAPIYREKSAQEHEDTEQSLTLAKEDYKFSKSSINYTEKRGKSYIIRTTELTEDCTSFTQEKGKEHNNKSPLYPPSPLLLQGHSPPTTEENNNNGLPPSSQPPQGQTVFTEEKKENCNTKSPLLSSSSSLLQGHSPLTTKENYNDGLPFPSQPLQDHTVFTKEKKEIHNIKSLRLPPSSSPLQGHTLPNIQEKAHKYNPSPSPTRSPRTQEEGGKGDIDPLHPSSIPNLGHGFPLSTFLRDKRFSLGRNSRMLSSQAADRLTQGSIGGADSLYWRALLQVVLVDRLGDVSHLSHVGRLSAKCHTFPEYAQAALARLGVSLKVTEEELQEYDRRHSSSKGRLERFFLLRASLAAVVEGAVLLDRLAYLCEQDDVSAFLVQLFNPVTSPRSHALIAIRARERTSTTTLSQGRE